MVKRTAYKNPDIVNFVDQNRAQRQQPYEVNQRPAKRSHISPLNQDSIVSSGNEPLNLLNRLGQQLLDLALHKLQSVVKPLNSHAQQLFQPCLRFQLLPALDLHFQRLLVGS